MTLFNSDNSDSSDWDGVLLKEIEGSKIGAGFAVLVRLLPEGLPKCGRFLFNPLRESEVEAEFEGLRKWLLNFYSSKENSAIAEFVDKEGLVCRFIAERVIGKLVLYIFGAGHVGQAVALLGALVGYEVVVVDDRAEFASRKWLPDPRVRLVVGEFDRVIDDLCLNSRSAAVIVTRGHQFDEICLRKLLKSRVSYLGMIGSKRRVISIFNRLKAEGFSPEEFDRVHAPIGLVIGARSPQEIAVAILGEIIAEVNK